MSTSFFDAIRGRLGADAVDVSPAARAAYGRNRLPGGDRLPDGVVYPSSVDDVVAVVEAATEHQITLWPTSTGRNIGLGEFSPVRAGQVVVHLGRRMNRIVDVDERLGYAVIEPGVTFRDLRAELARRGDTFMLSSTSGPLTAACWATRWIAAPATRPTSITSACCAAWRSYWPTAQ